MTITTRGDLIEELRLLTWNSWYYKLDKFYKTSLCCTWRMQVQSLYPVCDVKRIPKQLSKMADDKIVIVSISDAVVYKKLF